jgi:hypothetical protein
LTGVSEVRTASIIALLMEAVPTFDEMSVNFNVTIHYYLIAMKTSNLILSNWLSNKRNTYFFIPRFFLVIVIYFVDIIFIFR